MSQAVVPFRHQLLRMVDDMGALLDSVTEAQPAFLTARKKETLPVGLRRQISRLEALTQRKALAVHHRAHDTRYGMTRLPSGQVRYHRRT